jgi:hypothetical protein
MKYFLKINTSIVDSHSLKNDIDKTKCSLTFPIESEMYNRLVHQLAWTFNDFIGVDRQLQVKGTHSNIIVGLVNMDEIK